MADTSTDRFSSTGGADRPSLVSPAGAPVVAPMLTPARAGSLEPRGRWKRSLEVVADGWLKRIIESRHESYYSVFWTRNTMCDDKGDVHAEWAGYTADAIVRLARLLPDSCIASAKDEWLEHVLASQDPDGYLGCHRIEERWKHGFEIWSQDRMLQALLYEYEANGDTRVLDACVRAARCLARNVQSDWFKGVYCRDKTLPGPFQAGHSLNIVHPLFQLFEYTGDDSLRATALELYEDFDHSGQDISATGFLQRDNLRTHIVTVCEHLSIPAKVYLHTGDHRYLDASLRGFELLSESYQVTGTPSGNEDTYCRGPRKYTEHCGVIEWAISCQRLALQTGRVQFADAAERAMYNMYFASKSPDGVTLCYNHAPNQVVATDWSGPYEDDWDRGMFRNHYSMIHEPRCCNANTSRGFPNFVENAVATTRNNELAIVHYGPYSIQAELENVGPVGVVQDTDYPFEDEARMTISLKSPASFTLLLRIPGWCRTAQIEVNNTPVRVPIVPGQFASIHRQWSSGDTVVVRFDVPVTLDWYTNSWYAVPGVAVVRGALTYCLPIEERWEYLGDGQPRGDDLQEEWNVLPADGAKWNVALELDDADPAGSLTPVQLDVPDSSRPWRHAPIGLEVKAQTLPQWQCDTINGKPQTPALPAPPLKPAGDTHTVTLVPIGFTHLHMTYLPVLGVEQYQSQLYNEGKAAE